MNEDFNDELIAKFMGLSYKTIVTRYDYDDRLVKQVIYSNKKPILEEHYEGRLFTDVITVHKSFFEPANQEKDFKYKLYLNYEFDWDELMPVISKCYQEHMDQEIVKAVMTCDIETAYKAVIKFIKEYYEHIK